MILPRPLLNWLKFILERLIRRGALYRLLFIALDHGGRGGGGGAARVAE